MQYFKKELPFRTVNDSSGAPIRFEIINRNVGYLATDDPKIIASLQNMIQNRAGGVSEVGEDEYNEFIKKKPASVPSPRQYREELTPGAMQDTTQAPIQRVASLGQEVVNPAAIEAIEPVVTKPVPQRVGKRSKV